MDERDRLDSAPWDPPGDHPFEPRSTTFTPSPARTEPGVRAAADATPREHAPVPPRTPGGRPLAPTPSDELLGRPVGSMATGPTMGTLAGLSQSSGAAPHEVAVRIEVVVVDETARRSPGPIGAARTASPASPLSPISAVLKNMLMATALAGLILAMVVAAAFLLP